MKLLPLLNFSRSVIVLGLMSLLFHSCFLFPVGPESLMGFTPSLEWVKPVKGVAMDVTLKSILVAGNTSVNGEIRYTGESFSSEGSQKYSDVSGNESGIVRDILGKPEDGIIMVLYDYQISGSKNYTSRFGSGYMTNPYTKYNTSSAAPAIDPYPWSYGTDDLGPSITLYRFNYIFIILRLIY